MIDEKYDPRRYADRQRELDLFEQLIAFRDTKRILCIEDVGNTGKTHLLKVFEHHCKTRKRMPVSYVNLVEEELGGNEPILVVRQIRQSLARFEEHFRRFDEAEIALKQPGWKDLRRLISLDRTNSQQSSGSVSVRGERILADTQTPNFIGQINRVPGDMNINDTYVDDSENLPLVDEEAAAEWVVRVFFDDLENLCTNNPVVLLFDAYEACPDSIKIWIMDYLLEKHFRSVIEQPRQLALVLVGRKLPPFRLEWPQEDYESVVNLIKGLSKLQGDHIAMIMRTSGLVASNIGNEFLEPTAETAKNFILQGYPPGVVVGYIDYVKRALERDS